MKKLIIAICTLHTAICTLLAGAAAKDCYVRFNFTQLAGGTHFQLSELKLFNSQGMRINTGMTAFTSTTDATNLTEKSFINPYSATSHEWAGNLFDGNTGTKVCQTKTLPHLFTMRLAAGAYPVAYNFTSADDSFGSRSPVRWTVEASTNGVDWTTVDDKTNANQPYPTTQFTDYNGGTPYAFEYPWVGFKAAVVQSSVMYVPGTPAQPAVIVTNYFTANALTEGTDYTLAYSNNTAIGTGTVTIKGLNAYAGDEWSLNFAIVPGYTISLASATVVYDFSGGGAKASVTVRDAVNATKVLTEGTDYELVYANNEDIGTAKVTANGLGDYLGQSASANFTVVSAFARLPAHYRCVSGTDPRVVHCRTQSLLLYDGGFAFIVDGHYSFLLEFGSPRNVKTVSIVPRSGYESRADKFTVSGSNDMEAWTVITNFNRRAVVGRLNEYPLGWKPGSPAYRYLWVKFADTSPNIGELCANSDDLAIQATADASPFATTGVVAADAADGVLFSGKLVSSPDGSATVSAYAAQTDYGTDYAAWLENGVGMDFGSFAEGATFSGRLTGVNAEGPWYWRMFATCGDKTTACQPTYPFAIKSKVLFPHAYVMTAGMKQAYNGSTGWENDFSNPWIVFDLKDCDLEKYRLAGFRLWSRSGYFDRLIQASCDFGYAPSDGTEPVWNVTTTNLVKDAAGRVVDVASAIPSGITWVTDQLPYDTAALTQPNPVYVSLGGYKPSQTPRYIRFNNFGSGDVGEIEFRFLAVRRRGTVIRLK